MRFITKSGTMYYLDTVNRRFSGGKFKNWIPYSNALVIIGSRAKIYACDGRVITTSTVQNYFQ